MFHPVLLFLFCSLIPLPRSLFYDKGSYAHPPPSPVPGSSCLLRGLSARERSFSCARVTLRKLCATTLKDTWRTDNTQTILSRPRTSSSPHPRTHSCKQYGVHLALRQRTTRLAAMSYICQAAAFANGQGRWFSNATGSACVFQLHVAPSTSSI